ncbi:J domain-containing protein [Paenibacillus lignilyticus]|uniref:J domain-containing protein n=1 Tax=Paenibacillus lignilyticus TaxID=1172615 RepID=A0ABS5C7P4_9BACL|nr:J domain-containing protein [Paenibacillus lignilyticus]MBP3961969.1 J domain-containing protein [Paenibacillus lignilyticus]
MNDLKQAYELLGLPEGAAKEDVEKRYFILIRRDRVTKQREASEHTDEQGISLEEINRAYKLILEMEDQKTTEQFNQANYGKYKAMGPFVQKTEHFINYYKFHVLGVIAVILIIIFGTRAYIDHRHEMAELAKLPPVDVSVSFFGEYFSEDGTYPMSDLKPLENRFLSQFPDWKRVTVFFTYVPSQMNSQQDSAMIQKSMIDLMMNKADVYIMDRDNFIKLAQDGSLLPLDGENQSKLGSGYKPELALKTVTEDVPEQHVYGVDISGSPLMEGLPVIGKEYIAGIRINGEKRDNAFKFIANYLQPAAAK